MSLINLLAPVDSNAGGGGGPIGGDNKEDIIKFFETDDEPTPETIKLDKPSEKPDKKTKSGIDDDEEETEPEDKKGEKDEDEDEEIDELDEIEKDLEKEGKEDDEELELVEPVSRKEILAKYPKIFKEFPYLERAYYRERQFTDLFPTMEDAKVAVSRATALQNFEKQLSDGNIESVLTIVSKHNKEAFDKVVDTYIPTLLKVDSEAGYQVIGNVIKDTIISMHSKARKNNDAELMKVAKGLNEFVFGTDDIEPKIVRSTGEKKDDNKEDPVAKREAELTRREFERNRDTLNNRVEGMLRRTVEENIDPRESMSEYIRKNATRDAIEEVTKIIEKDTRFAGLLDRLWEKAIKGDFKKVDLDRIKDAYSSKARTLLPSVIKKARQEALKGMGKRVREEPEEKEEAEEPEDTIPRRKKSREATPSSNSGQDDKNRAKAIPANMSTRDYLDAD